MHVGHGSVDEGYFFQHRPQGWTQLAWLLLVSVFLLWGCGDFWAGVRHNQEVWNAYRNSPAYYDHVYSSTVTMHGVTTACTTTVNRVYRTVDTHCD